MNQISEPTLEPLNNMAEEKLDFSPIQQNVNIDLLSRPSLSYWADAWMRLKKNKQAIVSLWTTTALLLFAVVGPVLYRVNYSDQDLTRVSEPPTWNVSATVVTDTDDFVPLRAVLEDTAPEGENGQTLPAPEVFEVSDSPTIYGVKLRWSPVEGAFGYKLFRSEARPSNRDELGLEITTIDEPTVISFVDNVTLEPRQYFYSIVPFRDESSAQFSSLEVNVNRALKWSEALALDSNVQIGQMIPLKSHVLGTDYLGRDIMARLMEGTRVSLFIGIVAPLIYMFVGILLGGVAGYFGGRADGWIMRIADFVLALPFLLFMILLRVAIGGGPGESAIVPLLISFALLSWTGAARLVRGQVFQLREAEFVQAAKLLGAKSSTIIFRHLFPNTLGVILVSFTFAIPSAIFTEAFLAFIGLGVVPPTPSLGTMCAEGISRFLTHPHEFVFPAVLISIIVLAFNLLGDGLRDALDPRLRSR